MNIALTHFAIARLFDPQRGRITGTSAEDFIAYLNRHAPLQQLPGYAPFCKLLVYKNWTATRCGVIPITAANRHLLVSHYEARVADELPVLVRWFEGLQAPRANYLLVITYNREQLHKEGDPIDADWGVVGCLATHEPEEIPMAPITLLRNALGVGEGGSGVPLDRGAYQRSVEFWQQHANWR